MRIHQCKLDLQRARRREYRTWAGGRIQVREELLTLLKTVSRLAKGLNLPQFSMPSDKGDHTLVSVGRMWVDAEPLQQKFREQGLTEFPEKLNALVAKMSPAIDDQTFSKGSRVAAAQAITQTRQDALAGLARLDPLMRHLLREDAPVLAVWERARRVERPPAPKSVAETVTNGAADLSTAENVASAVL